MSHTPGEWEPDPFSDIEHMQRCLAKDANTPNEWWAIESTDDDIGGHVAYCHPYNVNIISAAPNLLNACKALVALIEKDYGGFDAIEEWQQAVKAINKAEEKRT